ncbi:DegT/DnrJ/EryC1/StrS aminotransferase family protein [Capnocytophaga sp. oral taxon 332 str. F0381]|uniref:LegC family aminotransferase n=1 Tax=Capnocytophaga sp. oral taxon 332 TaxID=712213 RepID=UPI0002A1A09C|nr:LegC family aminotransferase [Capnocytophaga sp. oral taxon 332]EKY07648.1 DegT/DnrJ/EryC1/StrS aminotransferase family protein [Capnocytophaga sp. oral taxon 332 str. F0381]
MNIPQTIAFIRSLYQEPDAFIPLHAPTFAGNEKKYLEECIDTTFVSSVGKFVDLFEQKVAEYTAAKYAVVCVNGTNALHIALKLSGVEEGDMVITQPLTFIATTNAIVYAGAVPAFVDVDKDTMGLSPTSLERFLQDNTQLRNGACYHKQTGRRIKACLPMHTFGHACRIEEIIAICEHYHIAVVEDAAEAMGSYYKGKHLGTFAPIGAISFNGNKTITTGGGGMILTNDETIAHRAKHLTTQAKLPHAWEFVHDEIGYNYRMPNINAALGVAQLEQLDGFLVNKWATAEAYKAYFEKQGIAFFAERENEKCNYWLNAIILKDKEERNAFLTEANAQGVMSRPIWQLMNRLPMFVNCERGDLSNAEWLEARVVNIPSGVRK